MRGCDDAVVGDTTDSLIDNFALPTTGRYVILATHFGGIFGVIVLLPLSIAYARRIWRRGAAVVTNLPKELGERFTRLEQAVDAIAVEVERLGEGQRYMTRIFTEQPQRQAIPAASEGTSPDQEGLRRR